MDFFFKKCFDFISLFWQNGRFNKVKRLLTLKKYHGIRGSSSLSSITLFWSTMLSSLNAQITLTINSKGWSTDLNLDFINRSSISKFENIHFDQCKSTDIAFLFYLLGMLELQCVGIFISLLYTWVSYIPLLINNLVSSNFEELFSTVSLIFLWYSFKDS